MTIYDFLGTLCSPEEMEFSIFDCNTENVLNIEYSVLRFSNYADYEIGGTDVWYNEKEKCIHFEFNVDIEEDN